MTIEFEELVNGVPVTKEWRGGRKRAIEEAVDWLAAEYRRYAKGWVYYERKSGQEFVVTKDGLAIAGAAILAGAKRWYSLWCTKHRTPLKEVI